MPLYGLFIVVFGHVLLPYPFWAGALPAKGGCEQTHTHNRVNFRTCPRPRPRRRRRCWCNFILCRRRSAWLFALVVRRPPAPSSTPFSASACPNNSHNLFIASPGKTNWCGKIAAVGHTQAHTHTLGHTHTTHTQAHTHSGTWLSKYLWATRDNLPAHRSFYWFLIQIAGKLMGKFQQQL